MSTRYLIAAAVLFGSGCAAQADTLPSTDSTFIASWKDSSGNDVASSGVLGNSALIGGVAYGNDSAAQAFAAKVSANLSSGASYTLVKGIDGEMLTSASSAQLAAMSGNGVAVVGWDDQRTVTLGQTGSAVSNLAVGSSASVGAATDAGAGAATGAGTTTQTGTAVGTAAGSDAAVDTVAGTDAGSNVSAGTGAGAGAGTGAALDTALADVPVTTAEVPEPSSIALLMAGMFGVLAIGRRRAR